MKTYTITRKEYKTSQNNLIRILLVSVAILVALYGLYRYTQKAYALTNVTTQMSAGSRGADVTNLQTFLATNSAIYPSGLVTGYFGTLTTDAVEQFQLHYGLPMVGRVGPQTLAKINTVIASGYGLDISAPTIFNVGTTTTSTTAVIKWTTNENAQGKVLYSTSPIVTSEVSADFTVPYVSGAVAQTDALLKTNQEVAILNLSPHTTYYYTIETMDGAGNVSLTWPATFITQ